MENIVQHSEGNGTEERLKRPQTCTESSTKYHNHPANETDNEEREHRLPTLQENAAYRIRNESDEERKHLNFTVKIIVFDATISSIEIHDLQNAREEYLSKGLRTADQPLHPDQQWVLQ